jgi:hypothetical protein
MVANFGMTVLYDAPYNVTCSTSVIHNLILYEFCSVVCHNTWLLVITVYNINTWIY